MIILKFLSMVIASFSMFTFLAALVPVWGRVAALAIIALAVSPMFLEGSEDNPNRYGGVGTLIILIAVGCLALMIGGGV